METKPHKNIFLDNVAEISNYTSKNQGGGSNKLPKRDKIIHGSKIKSKLQKIWDEILEKDEQKTAISLNTKDGTYLEFESSPNFDLTTKSLEDKRAGVKLLNVRKEKTEDESIINKATVFIPKGKENHFLDKVNSYMKKLTPKGKPLNESLIASINDIKLAVLESFWIGSKNWIPKGKLLWCEAWISSDLDNEEEKFRDILKKLKIEVKKERLSFPERRVLFIKVNRNLLQKLIETTDLVAEIRRATETATFFLDLENKEQTEWAKDLLDRMKVNPKSDTCISILDTGINNGHILLNTILNDKNCHSYDKNWEKNDDTGHGTQMAGLSAFGDLQKALENDDEIIFDYYLESFKILPPNGENNPQLYGAITTEAISNLIIDNPNKHRIICMAITAPKYETGDGSPSSWSASIDELTAGYIDGIKKLFIVSAGNIDNKYWNEYPDSNKINSVQNPGQSWNAITVGSYTEKCIIDIEKYGDKDVVANLGGLSPYSTTSMMWDNKWPIKPEIVLEGGNVIKDSDGYYAGEDELSLITTNSIPNRSQFTTIWATSASSAQATYMAVKLQSMYPNAWPETIRALLIHSASWTSEMIRQFLKDETKTSYRKLLRICGYGVPNLQKAIYCANNNVNLIVQSELQPFTKKAGKYITNDMHMYEIPWPKEVLESLFDTPVEMKVTLSYFIEPGPGQVGWKDRYRYSSCALRFDVNGSDTKEMFMERINKAVQDENNDKINKSSGGNIKWTLGPNNRNVGSIHSDIWNGTAAGLSTSNLIAVYPAVGWWRERHHLGRWNHKIRYSLVVSISTPKVTTDLYTPIINKINIKSKVKNRVEVKIPNKNENK